MIMHSPAAGRMLKRGQPSNFAYAVTNNYEITQAKLVSVPAFQQPATEARENVFPAALHNGMELLIGAGILFVVGLALKSARYNALKRPPRAVYRIPER